eukprot:3800855-Rhodomonas_salina.1
MRRGSRRPDSRVHRRACAQSVHTAQAKNPQALHQGERFLVGILQRVCDIGDQVRRSGIALLLKFCYEQNVGGLHSWPTNIHQPECVFRWLSVPNAVRKVREGETDLSTALTEKRRGASVSVSSCSQNNLTAAGYGHPRPRWQTATSWHQRRICAF